MGETLFWIGCGFILYAIMTLCILRPWRNDFKYENDGKVLIWAWPFLFGFLFGATLLIAIIWPINEIAAKLFKR